MSSTLITTTLALVSAGLMVYSVLVASRIFRQLPRGGFLQWWKMLLGLIVGFAACYFIFALTINERGSDPLLQLVVVIFFGAVFVLLTLQLFMHTLSSMTKGGWLNKGVILDESTGVYNLRYFEMRLHEEFERSRRYNNPLALLMIEVDNFKQITNSHGRSKSEKALEQICRLLKDNSRASDIIARYGGEQLVILLPNSSLFNARKAAEKYRAIMEEKVLEVADERDVISVQLNYTISIGLSSLQNDVKRASELQRRADIALYKAKERGRNWVAIYGE